MTTAKTLLQLAGADLTPPRLADAALVLIDIQNEYLAGPLALPDAKSAIARAATLLAKARAANAPIIHIAHRGKAGGSTASTRSPATAHSTRASAARRCS